LPSADHAGLLGSRLQFDVRLIAGPPPPATGAMQMSFSMPRPFEHTNAIVLPSGDQAGELLCPKPVRTARTLLSPSVYRNRAGIASSRTSWFSVESCSNAIALPSGDQTGAPWLRSPLVS